MTEPRSWTVLHQAVSDGDEKLTQQLLASAEIHDLINKKDASGWTPLVVAARLGDLPSLRLLLNDPRIDVEARDDCKCTALRHALGTGHNVAACELLMAGADARNGLLPFIMLDTYNRLMAYMERTIGELEAELEPHRLLRQRLALLLHKQGLQPSAGKVQKARSGLLEECDVAIQLRSDQGQRQHTQQQQLQPTQSRKPMLKGVHRDAAEIEQAALRVKQLQQEIQPIRQCPLPPAMQHAVVALVQAVKDQGGTVEPQASGAAQQPSAQVSPVSRRDLSACHQRSVGLQTGLK